MDFLKAISAAVSEHGPALAAAALVYVIMEFRAVRHEIRAVRNALDKVETQIQKDRAENKSDHKEMFEAVGGLQADVKVLLARIIHERSRPLVND